ncbi:YafY family protein [uncultured Sulfitobacter sp.]|uniref:helix-turn-helix transcriptional regulator n=1 Tax=uncultured Sulfitobacter sp. TaxID=191468 RepID=UPI0026098183|nr:YafY family protein [uncultured Sulfitobacter sp.]
MPKSDRYFEIIQMLRHAKSPLRAAQIAETLEVSPRTIYRDIAILQARQIPILGEAGVGYVMRAGYDLPPLNLDATEADAVALGLAMIIRTGDPELWQAARRAARKLHTIAPGTQQLVASSWGTPSDPTAPIVRDAIRTEQALNITYTDGRTIQTTRTIWPLALIYYADNIVLAAWCTLRHAIRHFRLDRMQACTPDAHHFTGHGAALLTQWETHHKAEAVAAATLF